MWYRRQCLIWSSQESGIQAYGTQLGTAYAQIPVLEPKSANPLQRSNGVRYWLDKKDDVKNGKR